ncbi:mannitol dehydrogenase family protein [Roseiarcus sp.]|uniref:mannitol dehydrogenase family protein n=1 Tax=Roseiarcus sp. TaxID=1969460 RepID=UPI003C55569B
MAFPIIQFGTSRFLQAHVDLFVSEALTKGAAMGRIVAVQTTQSAESRKRIAAFAEGRPYVVQIKGIAGGAIVDIEAKVSSVGGGVDANESWEAVERLFNEARCMVSNTADRGYELDPSDRPDAMPRSFPAKLAKLLLARHRAGAPPITLFPCELTPANGETLRAVVLKVLDGWSVPAPARRWVGQECVWINSLVDRIVSQPLEPLGAVAEPYALWAIEDQPGLEVPCRHRDVVVTNDLKRYERLKLFILNLGHTWLAEIWRRSKKPPAMTVREAMANESMVAELDDLYEKEVLPVFAGIGMEQEARTYRDTVVDRFRNPFLDHRLAEIFVNHEAKKQRRFGGLIELAEASNCDVSQPRVRGALASNEGAPSTPAG